MTFLGEGIERSKGSSRGSTQEGDKVASGAPRVGAASSVNTGKVRFGCDGDTGPLGSAAATVISGVSFHSHSLQVSLWHQCVQRNNTACQESNVALSPLHSKLQGTGFRDGFCIMYVCGCFLLRC